MELIAVGYVGLGGCIHEVVEAEDFLAKELGVSVHVEYDGALLAVLVGVPQSMHLGF